MEQLQEFIDTKYDAYKDLVTSVGQHQSEEYSEKMKNASTEIKNHIETLHSNIKVSSAIISKIQQLRTFYHQDLRRSHNFEKEVTNASGVDMSRGPSINSDLSRSKDNYNKCIQQLLSCIATVQTLDPDNIDENIFEKLRLQNKIRTPGTSEEDIISFSNKTLQYAYTKYCESKTREEQIEALQTKVGERDNLISFDTEMIQKLNSTIIKQRDVINVLQRVTTKIQTIISTVSRLAEMHTMANKESFFTRIKNIVKPKLPKDTEFSTSISGVMNSLNDIYTEASEASKPISLLVSDNSNSETIQRQEMLSKIKAKTVPLTFGRESK